MINPIYQSTQAISNLRPGAKYSLTGTDYIGLDWQDTEQTKPSEEEFNIELARIQAEYVSTEYQRLRAAEYPSFADQFDLLYHGGYDAWKASIDEIKNKYPKGVSE